MSQEMLKFAIPALGISIASPFMTFPGSNWSLLSPGIAPKGLGQDGFIGTKSLVQ